MSKGSRRSEERKKALIQAFVSDRNDSFDIKCVLRDISPSGCKLVTSRVDELPAQVHVTPEGFPHALRGVIMWREGKAAGVAFEPMTEAAWKKTMKAVAGKFWKADNSDSVLLTSGAGSKSYAERLARYHPAPREYKTIA